MDNTNLVGAFATSKAGHDKGKLYLVIDMMGDFAWVIDGDRRPLEKPKRKNTKHLLFIKEDIDPLLKEKVDTGTPLRNEEVKRAILLRTRRRNQECQNPI